MKTLATTGYERAEFEHVRLYRDDLDRIIGLMSASGLKVRLCDAYFEYESLDEFAEKKGESPRRFQIEVLNEREFDIFSMSYRSRMWLIEADPDMSVLYLKITDLLRERQSRFSRIPVFSLLFCCIGLNWLGVLVGHFASGFRTPSLVVSWAGMFVVICLGVYRWAYARVILKLRYQGGFFSRHRDHLLLSLFGAVMGSAITALINWIVNRAAAPHP